jgi:hypothetical protein
LALLLFLGACRRHHAPPEEAPAFAPTPAPAPVPAPAPGSAPSAEPSPAAPPVAGDARTTPPTEAELRAALDPTFDALGRCLAGARLPDGGPLLLRFSLWPSGQIVAAEIVPVDGARRCATQALAEVRLPAWRGSPTVVTVPLDRTGQPMAATDGGSGR